MFTGSYNKNDCIFLLKPIKNIQPTPIEEKEKLIQQGIHYSNFLTPENPPSKEYLNLFYQLLDLNLESFINNLLILAKLINNNYKDNNEIVIVSLARAGTPIGILLKRILEKYFHRNVIHYSISIIRDRGIDENALKYILSKHNEKDICFVDGWTGKGVIKQTLEYYIQKFNKNYNKNIKSDLYVLNDISYQADYSASYEDQLIPSSMLNSIISGLISRSILNKKYLDKNDFHGCKYFEEFKNYDLSNWFIDKIMEEIDKKNINIDNIKIPRKIGYFEKRLKKKYVNGVVKELMKKHNVSDINYIKPGIGEATRVLLRRIPDILIVKNKKDKYIQHLINLANEKDVPVYEEKDLFFNAVALIKELKN